MESEQASRPVAPWGEREDAVLDLLVAVARGRVDAAQAAAQSLQTKIAQVGGAAAVALGLEANALSLGRKGAPVSGWESALLLVGALLLCATLVAAAAAYRPVPLPGLGSLARWRQTLVVEGGTRTAAHLVVAYDDLLQKMRGHISRYARAARLTQWLLVLGAASGLLGAVLRAAGV